MAMAETAEEISKKPEVRQALSQASGPRAGEEKVKAATKDKFWFVTHALLIVGCAVLYYLVGSKLIPVPQNTVDLSRRFLRGAVLIVIVLAVAKAISIYAIGRLDDAATRFTLRRIEHLLVVLVIAVIVIGVIFVTWYTALISLGIGSVIVGLAVQTPMTSFLGWIYILIRRPYQVGDRIQIEDATGDVIDVSYFYTAYDSDLEFVSRTMQKITEEEIGEEMMERVAMFRELLAKTPVDELEVRERPRVIFRVNENTWLEAIVRYLVPPREAGSIKTRLLPKLLAALNAAPEKTKFPKGDAR